jgi:hypothetical protein
VPLYCYKHAPVELDKADNVQIALGLQPSGRYLNLVDLDSHKPGQDAAAARAAFEAALPHLASKIDWHPTPNRGYHGFIETHKKLPTGRLYDSQGNHIGELLSEGSHTRDHGDIAPPTLSLTEIDHLFLHWSVDNGEPGGERWKERAKEGAKFTAGYTRIRVTKDDLRAFLVKECGGVGATLNAYFDERGIFDRSAAAGNLMQTLMYHARRMPGAESYRTVMAYWMAAESYGKASDRDYNQEKDGCSLIAQIVHGDIKKNGKPWIAPFWVKGKTVDNVNGSEPEPPPARPAHRPVGDREKHLATFRRVLESIVPDDFGRRTYTLGYLVDKMKAARCPAKSRTIQSYLKKLRDDEEIVTAQIGGNGTPYAVLTRCFGGADNYQKRVEIALESPADRGADQIADERILTPQTAETSLQCKEDHQNPSAPTAEPGGASYDPRHDATQGGTLLPWIDPTAMRVPEEWIDRRPPPYHARRQQRQKGQLSFVGRGQDVKATYQRRKTHGTAPAPAPYRPRARLEIEDLPELGAVAPAGAHSFGAPLLAPAGAGYGGAIERLQRLKAEREAAHVE